jgi:hypothetical protein
MQNCAEDHVPRAGMQKARTAKLSSASCLLLLNGLANDRDGCVNRKTLGCHFDIPN